MAEIYKVDQAARKFLFEGVQGENEARSIQFDITPWTTELGNGAVTATAKRPTDAAPYPVTVTRDGNTVTWKPTSTDTAIDGAGMFQLEYTVDDVLAKTCIWSTMVAPSLDPAGDPPDPYDNWLAEMRSIEANAIQAADDAEDSADAAAASAAEAEVTVSDVNAGMQGFKQGEDILFFDVVNNSYVTKQGVITPYNGWSRTDYIEVEEGKVLHVVNSVASSQYNCWYDSSKDFVSAFTVAKGDDIVVTVPQNAKYAILSNATSSLASKIFYEQSFYADKTDIELANRSIDTIGEYYFNNEYLLKKEDLKQGYFSQGTGFVTTGGDAAKYLTYMMTNKLKKGSFIKVVSDKWFCGIDIYNDGNWNASSTKIGSASLAQNYEFTMQTDGYIAITFASASRYADRTAISADNYTEAVTIVPMLKVVSSHDYDGEKINVKKHGFSVFKSSWQFVSPSNANAISGQSATQYGSTIFKCWEHDVMQSYNAETGEVIAEFDADSGHGNSISFSNEFYADNDDFPLAYVTPEETDGAYQLFNVLRLTTSTATLVKTIAVPTEDCGYYANAVVDADKNILYLNGYTYHSYHEAIVGGNDNLMRITAWDLSDLTAAGDYFVPTFIKEFTVPFISTHQGHAFFDNKIFSVKSEISNTQTVVYVIDPYKERIVSTFADFPADIKNNECEGIWFADNGNEYSMFICRLIQVYECVFN